MLSNVLVQNVMETDRKMQLISATLLVVLGSLVQKTSSVEIIAEKIAQVGTKDYLDSSDVKVRRVGKSRQLFGKFIIKVPLNDSVQAKVFAYMKTGAGWNLLPYKIEKPACAFFQDDTFLYPEITKFSDFPLPMPCPVPSATFELQGWEPSLEKVPSMLLKNGDYKISFSYFLGAEEIYNLVAFGSVINIHF